MAHHEVVDPQLLPSRRLDREDQGRGQRRDPRKLRDSLLRVRRRTSLQMPEDLLEWSIDPADTVI